MNVLGVAGLACTLALTASTHVGARITLYATLPLRGAMAEITTAFSNAYGAEVIADYRSSAAIRGRIDAGEPADFVVATDLEYLRRLGETGRGPASVAFIRE